MKTSLALLLLAALRLGNAFYLPGVVPKQFMPGEKVPVKVNSLTSIRTHLPYDYYKLPFCKVGVRAGPSAETRPAHPRAELGGPPAVGVQLRGPRAVARVVCARAGRWRSRSQLDTHCARLPRRRPAPARVRAARCGNSRPRWRRSPRTWASCSPATASRPPCMTFSWTRKIRARCACVRRGVRQGASRRPRSVSAPSRWRSHAARDATWRARAQLRRARLGNHTPPEQGRGAQTHQHAARQGQIATHAHSDVRVFEPLLPTPRHPSLVSRASLSAVVPDLLPRVRRRRARR